LTLTFNRWISGWRLDEREQGDAAVSSYEELRDVEAELREGEALFDARLAELRGETSPSDARRRHILALIEQGATEGERAAASAALGRLEASHRESDSMQRGGNWIDEP
jgi:hypothetical protein